MVSDVIHCRYDIKGGRGTIIQDSGDQTDLFVYKASSSLIVPNLQHKMFTN
jgi:hypothetical protein